ncbi:GspH/FimT family pseudopilin [Luteimonas sp. S4-F44]|uniref:GspH/FimT family pseudopilin n=1 Tax=Luteimonas sp. S4-F44 TaxID=2925842 RepID=UPI001F536306|nr:GspH/FimT family pseudopilin [Luteimonas sp. S4-F44]UNK43461.1 GspH/FimT family pseudopilin [Luteimonas sp. S4-F44]
MQRERGVTLLELMCTVSVLLVFTLIGVPAFAQALAAYRAISAAEHLKADLALARNAAVTGGKSIVVCPRTEDNRCRDDGAWTLGWLVLRDPDRDLAADADHDLLRIAQPPGLVNGNLAFEANRPFVRYRPDGRSVGTNLTIAVCSAGRVQRRLIVNNAGRARTERTTDAAPCGAG